MIGSSECGLTFGSPHTPRYFSFIICLGLTYRSNFHFCHKSLLCYEMNTMKRRGIFTVVVVVNHRDIVGRLGKAGHFDNNLSFCNRTNRILITSLIRKVY